MGLDRDSVAKITRPPPDGCYPRHRLFRALDRGLKRSILWISAPPGSGKTTLVSSYVAARKLPCIWYQVDSRDGDVATCFHYLGLAARKSTPGIRKPLPLLTPESLLGLPAFTRRYFEALFSRLPSPGLIVFDDCHAVPVDSPFHEVVREGLSFLPEGIRVILISRGPSPVVFSRILANREMGEFGSDDLRFTPEETWGMADRTGYTSLSRKTIRELQEKTGGWAAGISILMREHRRGKASPRPGGSGATQGIFDYFAGEIFGKVDPEVRDFLRKSAILSRMTADMAEKVTGHTGASRILSYLDRHNLFTDMHPGEVPVYEYHSLFREFLLHHAEGHLTHEETCAMRHRAAAVLEKSGQTADAIDLLRRCGDFRGVCRMIRKEAPSLALQEHRQTLREWILSLPEDLRSEEPWMLYWTGVCSQLRNPAESRAAFEQALDLFSRAGEETGAFLSWSGIVDTILFEWNDFGSLDRWIDWLDHRGGLRSPFPSVAVEARVSAAMAMALVFRRPQHAEIAEWVLQAFRLSRDISDPEILLNAYVANSNYRLWIGDRAGNDLVMKALRRIDHAKGTSPPLVLSAKWLEAVTAACSEGDPDETMRLVEEGLRISDSTGIRGWDFLLNMTGACAALTKGDDRAARKFLDRMFGMLSPARRHGYCQYHYLAAWSHLSRGETLKAKPHAEEAVAVAIETGMYFPEVLCRLALANVRHEKGETEGVREEIARALSLAVACRSRILEFMGLLSKAGFLLDRGDEPGGLEALRDAMAIGREGQHFNLFWWWRPKAMARLCSVALETGIEVPYVREMIRKNRLVPDPSAPDLEQWPWPVKVYTLGRFSLVVDGNTLPSVRKTRQKPLLLLKALIALGGRNVPEEQITEVLWPEADGDLAHQTLAKTLERLREMLGDDRVVLLRDGRLTLNSRHCWVDVWEFERTLGRADAVGKPGAHARNDGEIVRLAERAIALYRGTFLSGETFCSGIITHRERLRSKFLRTIVLSGRHWERAGEWEKALTCYQKGLEVDPLSEDMYRGLISCNVRMGRAAEAHAVYQRCRKTLSAELGVSPSPDLQALLASAPAAPEPVGK